MCILFSIPVPTVQVLPKPPMAWSKRWCSLNFTSSNDALIISTPAPTNNPKMAPAPFEVPSNLSNELLREVYYHDLLNCNKVTNCGIRHIGKVSHFNHTCWMIYGTYLDNTLLRHCWLLLEVLLPSSASTRVPALVGKRTSNKSVERRFLGSVGVRDPIAYLTFRHNPRAKPCNVTSE